MTVVCCQERLARNYHKNKSPLLLTHVRYTLICRLSSAIVWVRIVFRKTVLGDWCFDYLSSGHLQLPSLRRSKTSVTNNSLSEDYSQPDNCIYHVDVLIGKCCWMDWILLDQNTHILMIIGNCIRWNFACKFIIFFSSISFPTLNMKMENFCCKNCQLIHFNPFTPKSDQLQCSLSVSHQRYIS